MKSDRKGTPRPDVVQDALRKTTEALAGEVARASGTTPDWSEFEWRAARAAAAIHGIAPLLAVSLRWQGAADWATFLAEQRANTTSRHRRIEALQQLIHSRAREAGLAIIPLKGAALHTSGLYAPGERPMADLDLLVRGSDLASATRLLEGLGYRETVTFWKNRVFTPNDSAESGGLGEQPGNNIKIELHWQICEKLPVRMTDISDLVFLTQPHPGLNAYPSHAALMLHLIQHAAGAMVVRTLRMLQLHDLALLAERMSGEDWNEVLRQGTGACGPWWALPPLRLVTRYYPGAIPSAVLTALTRGCPSSLRRVTERQSLTDVSLSSIWVKALPGIEWSQSIIERLEYIAGRVRPSAETLRIRKGDADSGAWATQNKWDHLPQRARIMRWIISRPTRPATMYVMRAALA
ncbi:MAG: hypothetical protein JWM63_5245 [Gammaproteobacteria bacterium]|jgi:hypothetical protein|nr:hypothetical protein [Gammaproteobacteria bacterium]